MIVNIRIDVSDEHRNAFSRMLHPRAEKRLATREEYVAAVKDFVFVQEMGARKARVAEAVTRQGQGQGSVEISQPEPSYAVHREESAPESIEKHGTGVIRAPEQPAAAALFHVNRAMFALGDLQRMSEDVGCVDSVNRLVCDLMDLRQDFVERHDSERQQEWVA